MNGLSRIITGGVMIIVGIVLSVLSFFNLYFLLIYGLPIFILGLIIFFNKKEDSIEKIRWRKK